MIIKHRIFVFLPEKIIFVIMKNIKIVIVIALVLITLIAVALYSLFLSDQKPSEEEAELPILSICEYEHIPVDSFDVEVHAIQKNEFLSQILTSLGATNDDVSKVSLLEPGVFDAKSLRVGSRYKAYYALNDSCRKLCYWVYEKTPADYSVFCFRDTFFVYNGKKEIDKRLKLSKAEITSSLWNATVENNIDINLSLFLSDIYAWTIDFFGLQKGDQFSVLYDELYVDSTFVGIGQVHAAQFYHGDKDYYAFYFEQDSVGGYWDQDGNSLKRAFLKAPLKFSRISSTFSYARRHPVLRVVRPHTGVDYAAPTGTPVMSIGNGTVISKGYAGGGGNTVKIRHNSVYTTAYLHLSRFAQGLKVGQTVSQGQLIGYVGSTGTSTGPHLDFRVWKNNSPINPLTIESPPVEPVHEKNKVAFDSVCTRYLQQLK